VTETSRATTSCEVAKAGARDTIMMRETVAFPLRFPHPRTDSKQQRAPKKLKQVKVKEARPLSCARKLATGLRMNLILSSAHRRSAAMLLSGEGCEEKANRSGQGVGRSGAVGIS
jgi:hypothetical protein